MSDTKTRFADRIFGGIAECPDCGREMPGFHERRCQIQPLVSEVERMVRTPEGRAAVLRLVQSFQPKPATTGVEPGEVWTHHSGKHDPVFRPMTVLRVGPETLRMSDNCDWTPADLESAGWSRSKKEKK